MLQHPRRGEVAAKDFSGVLCDAKWVQEVERNQRDFFRIRHGGRSDSFCVRHGGADRLFFLVPKLPLGNAISRSSAAWCALGVPRGLLSRPAKAKRELRGRQQGRGLRGRVPSPVDGDFERPCNPLIRDRPKGEGTCPRCVPSAAEFPDTLKQELGNERPKEENMAVDGLAAIFAFFGVV